MRSFRPLPSRPSASLSWLVSRCWWALSPLSVLLVLGTLAASPARATEPHSPSGAPPASTGLPTTGLADLGSLPSEPTLPADPNQATVLPPAAVAADPTVSLPTQFPLEGVAADPAIVPAIAPALVPAMPPAEPSLALPAAPPSTATLPLAQEATRLPSRVRPFAPPAELRPSGDLAPQGLPPRSVAPLRAQSEPPAPPPTSAPSAQPNEPKVLVAEVFVTGVSETLQAEVYRVIRTRPGQTATRSQLQEDISRVFATGLFANVRAFPEDTPLGVRVTFAVESNPVLRQVAVTGSTVLPADLVTETFRPLYGSTLNLNQLQDGIKALNKWYQDNGYVLSQFVGSPQVSPDGTVTLEVAEGTVEAIKVAYLNDEGKPLDEDGKPVEGRTREFIVTREMDLKPGSVFNRNTVQADLRRIFGLGIFEDVQLTLNPGSDPRKVEVSVNVQEKNTAVLGAEVGFSSSTGIFGTGSFQQQNVGGNNQKFGLEVQLSERGLGFDVSFTDPWIAGDPYRTSYTLNAFKRRSISLIFDGGDEEVRLANGDRPRVDRTGGRVTFTRPLSKTWTASLGLEYQHVYITDADGRKVKVDELGNDLSFSGTGSDDLLTIQFGAVQDLRNDKLFPTSGSLLRFATEQSIPIGSGSILFNRVRANYSRYFPINFTNFTDGPEALAINLQGGAFLGDLPPYEAFPLGGTNSVRGFGEGEVGSARYFVQGSVEYRFPIFKVTEQIPVGGVFFVDFASDLGSGSDVPGDPAGVRDKPGSGAGVGVGLRARTPFGPIRLDYGWGTEGESRLHFGIGERF